MSASTVVPNQSPELTNIRGADSVAGVEIHTGERGDKNFILQLRGYSRGNLIVESVNALYYKNVIFIEAQTPARFSSSLDEIELRQTDLLAGEKSFEIVVYEADVESFQGLEVEFAILIPGRIVSFNIVIIESYSYRVLAVNLHLYRQPPGRGRLSRAGRPSQADKTHILPVYNLMGYSGERLAVKCLRQKDEV